jgi:hypothetical protein
MYITRLDVKSTGIKRTRDLANHQKPVHKSMSLL